MKLTRIELRNFLSHSSTDFELDGCRLASIVGANGAGKSSILDAVQYCLFDSARGRTDDLVRLGASDMSAAVTFDFAGATYRVTRGRTSKAGGKSFLELAIRCEDGSWRPLTADTIRETQAAIEALLHMDSATFETAAFLGQGKASAFADATAAERKRILGQVLGLERWAAAEARAREEARDLDGSLAADRATAARLEAEIGLRSSFEDKLDEAQTCALNLEIAEAAERVKRDGAERRRSEVAAAIAAGESAEREVQACQARLQEQQDRYRGAAARRNDATSRRQAAENLVAPLLSILEVDREAAAAEVARLEAIEARDRELERAADTADRALTAQRNEFDRLLQAWKHRRDTARARVDELASTLEALPPITCPKCNHSWPHDQAGIGAKLLEAKAALQEIGAEPAEPAHLALEEGKLERLRYNRRELAFDPDALGKARGALAAADANREALARREGHLRTIEDCKAIVAAATAELATIEEAGRAAKAALAEATERACDLEPLRRELAEVETAVRMSDGVLRVTADERRKVEGEIATHRAALERIDRLTAEAKELAEKLADASVRLGRLHRLVQAFGVTGIPARIIESVLPELSANANELLSQLRPGMELSIRAQRAKKDGKGVVEALDLVVSDAVGERALAMFSGGERMSVNLATGVGLNRLAARRAGTAIRTLVIDEPDGLDADARRSFGQALRILAHQGELERVVLISHHQDLADVGDATWDVVKGPAGSVVTRIA